MTDLHENPLGTDGFDFVVYAAPDPGLLADVRSAVGAFPVWIGSGLDLHNAGDLWPQCDGANR